MCWSPPAIRSGRILSAAARTSVRTQARVRVRSLRYRRCPGSVWVRVRASVCRVCAHARTSGTGRCARRRTSSLRRETAETTSSVTGSKYRPDVVVASRCYRPHNQSVIDQRLRTLIAVPDTLRAAPTRQNLNCSRVERSVVYLSTLSPRNRNNRIPTETSLPSCPIEPLSWNQLSRFLFSSTPRGR